MTKKGFELVAAIDVGSNALRMIIAQITAGGEIILLEEVKKTTHIGHDTFALGKIGIDTIHTACQSLKNFVKLMEDYKVRHYRAVATSGIREAVNREYILEQIRTRTGLNVQVISNAEERLLTYKAIRDHLAQARTIRQEGAMIVDIGSGGVEASVYSEGHLLFTEYIKVGSLRLKEILTDLERQTLHFPEIMEEFIESKAYLLKPRVKELKVKNFIGLGGEMSTITRLCLKEEAARQEKFIEKPALNKLYSNIRTMTTDQIVGAYQLDHRRAEILLPSVIIFNSFLAMTEAGGIHIPGVSLRHGLLADMVDTRFDTPRKRDFDDDIICSVHYMARRYNLDIPHSQQVEKLALTIFDQTARTHRLSRRERMYLQIAAILHDVGKFVNLNRHHIHSYNVIRAQNIMGISEEEYQIIANVARYHSDEDPAPFHENYLAMPETDRIVAAKLAAILKLADALDISHKQKIRSMEIVRRGNELHFIVPTMRDILLEKWSFQNKSAFFEEVMGQKPVFIVRGEKV